MALLSGNFKSTGGMPVLRNQPIPVFWAGFVTNTCAMGRHGWDLATEEDYRRGDMNVIIHHRGLDISGYGTLHSYSSLRQSQIFQAYQYHARMMNDYNGDMQASMMLRQLEEHHQRMGVNMGIEIKAMASRGKGQIRIVGDMPAFKWRDTDPTHSYVESFNELHDLPLFDELSGPKVGAQELIVNPEDVQSILDKILAVQAPGMKDIRARNTKREQDEPETKRVHAQIISLQAA